MAIAAPVQADLAAKEKFAGAFPNLTIDGFAPAPVEGLFEVIAGDQIFYFSPEGYLVFGEIWSKEGKNLPADRRGQIAAEKTSRLPLEKAVRIGNGPHTVVEFTDPDCSYCRKVDQFFSGREDVTRYVFLFPLTQIHPEAAAKSKLILCSEDPVETMHQVFSGRYDGKRITLPAGCDGEGRLQKHLAQGRQLGVRGTPALWIDGQPVSGADFQRITSLLEQTTIKPK